MLSLDEVRAESDPSTFPLRLLPAATSAACFYAAGFLGRNDVIHIADAGLRDVVLIDTDESKLQDMHRIYPEGWAYLPQDAEAAALYFHSQARTFDLVIVDPWTGGILRSMQFLHTWLTLANQAVIIGTSFEWFADKHMPPTLDALNDWVRRSHWNGMPALAASQLLWRSSYRGGVYWAVFEKNVGR